jgi:hypothetical protein
MCLYFQKLPNFEKDQPPFNICYDYTYYACVEEVAENIRRCEHKNLIQTSFGSNISARRYL